MLLVLYNELMTKPDILTSEMTMVNDNIAVGIRSKDTFSS